MSAADLGAPEPALPAAPIGARRSPKLARLIVELDPRLVAVATNAARERREPLARLVGRALRAVISTEGAAVMLAAVLVGLSGCREPVPVDASGSTWGEMQWGPGTWAADDSAQSEAGPCTSPARLPCTYR